MRPSVFGAAGGGLALAAALVLSNAPETRAQGPPAAAAPGPKSAEEAAVRAVAAAFAKAYNADDAQGVAALFADDGEVVLEDGTAVRGKEAVRRHFAESFQRSPGSQVDVRIDAITFPDPDVAKEEGTATVTLPAEGGRKETGRYTVLHVKRGGRWLQSSVRVYPPDAPSAHDRLKDLAWLVGDWVDEEAGSVNVASCRWVDGENFLERSFTVHVKGRPVKTGTQRIGWDAQAKQVKSWMFDSEGGHGEGYWSRAGDQWVVKAVGTHADGRRATATQVITVVNKDTSRWRSVDRTVGDEVLPDLDEYVMVRKPPAPGATAPSGR